VEDEVVLLNHNGLGGNGGWKSIPDMTALPMIYIYDVGSSTSVYSSSAHTRNVC
jgi:hypothetical protein